MTKLSLACGLALSAVLAACSSVPKAASTATAAPTGTAAELAAAKKQKLLCDDENMTGSHMTQRLCLTPEEAAERHKDSQQAAIIIQQTAHEFNSDKSVNQSGMTQRPTPP